MSERYIVPLSRLSTFDQACYLCPGFLPLSRQANQTLLTACEASRSKNAHSIESFELVSEALTSEIESSMRPGQSGSTYNWKNLQFSSKISSSQRSQNFNDFYNDLNIVLNIEPLV